MLINGNSLELHIVKLVKKEEALWKERQELMNKFESAENCGNSDEMQRIGMEGMRLNNKMNVFMMEKITVMTMATDRNPDFIFN